MISWSGKKKQLAILNSQFKTISSRKYVLFETFQLEKIKREKKLRKSEYFLISNFKI